MEFRLPELGEGISVAASGSLAGCSPDRASKRAACGYAEAMRAIAEDEA